MIKKLFIKTQAIPNNVGKGTYVQAVLQTVTIHKLVAQKPPGINRWATYKYYKTT